MFVRPPIDSKRKCGRCGEFKAASDFPWRRKARGQRDNYCRTCRAAYKQEHYRLNQERLCHELGTAEKGGHRETDGVSRQLPPFAAVR